MSKEFYYHTIEKPALAEFTDRGSKFIAYVFPIADVMAFKEALAQLKKEHPKASHHCFAYRIGYDKLVYRVSDDGEPSGSAGRPILGAIDSLQLTNVLAVVVRYFGGTLLGVPGLINAYKTSVQLAFQQTPILKKPILSSIDLEFDYTVMNDVMRIVKQGSCSVLNQDQGLFCTMKIGVPLEQFESILNKIRDLRVVAIRE
jgi:uncharacterized YigZ family protein